MAFAFVFLALVVIWLWNSVCVLRPDEHGVVTRLGAIKPNVLQPGLRLVLWPVETLYRVSTLDQTLEVQATDIETADKGFVSLRINIRFRVTDAYAALTEVADYRARLGEFSEYYLRQHVAKCEAQEAREGLVRLTRQVRDQMFPKAQSWGILIEDFKVEAIKDS